MEGLKFILEQIEKGLMENISIAVVAIAFWIGKAEGMSTENLLYIMGLLGYEFSEENVTLTVGETTYTIFQLIGYCIHNIYKTSDVLLMATMQNITKKSERLGYITHEQRVMLDADLVEQLPQEGLNV